MTSSPSCSNGHVRVRYGMCLECGARTNHEQVEYLARFMRYRIRKCKKKNPYYDWERETDEGGGWTSWEHWNPFINWNHWREIELKILEDEKLFGTLQLKFCKDSSNLEQVVASAFHYTKADLPERVAALIQAHKQLNPLT